jgi:bifunctional non-homologous end joining protein LigD
MLNGRTGISLVYVIFDVLELNGEQTMYLPYHERRLLLDSLGLQGTHWQTSAAFEDGEALWTVVEEQGLEGLSPSG